MSTKTIIRRQKYSQTKFFATARATAQDSKLSFEARGLLWYLLSKPDDWKVMVADLQREGGIGRDKVYKLLNELKAARYIEREPVRDKNARVVAMEYIVHEEPLPEKPDTEKPDTANTDIYKETEGNKAKKKRPSLPSHVKAEQDAAFDAVKEAWGITNGGLIANYRGLIFGMGNVRGAWKEMRPATPLTLEEFKRFVPFAKKRMQDKSQGYVMPTTAETLAKTIEEFRVHPARPSGHQYGDRSPDGRCVWAKVAGVGDAWVAVTE